MPTREVVLWGGYADGTPAEVSYCEERQCWPELHAEIGGAPVVENLIAYGMPFGAIGRIPVRVAVYCLNPETDRYEFDREEVYG